MPYKDLEMRKACVYRWQKSHPEKLGSYSRTYYEAHREKLCARARAYRQEHLEERAAYDHAYEETHREKKATNNRAWRLANPERVVADGRAWREANQEKCRTSARSYRLTHLQEHAALQSRRHALKHGATVGIIDLEAIKVRDRMRCCICGKKVAESDFSLDHTVPLSLGGTHSQENLRVAHRRCNSRRGAGRLPVQMVLV